MSVLFDLSGTVGQRRVRNAALAAGGMAAIAGVGLLALSGWFLTGAALAGAAGVAAVQGFNYLLPSAAIRGFAIVRTLGRYGERLLGHRFALFVLADLRPRLFARLAGAPPQATARVGGGDVAGHLGSDVEALEEQAIRRVTIGTAMAGAAAGLAAAAMAGLVPALVLALGLLSSSLLATWLAPRWLATPHRDYGEALAAYKSAYAEYAGCSVEIAIYGLAPRIAAELTASTTALDRARTRIVRREASLRGMGGILASGTVAAMLATSHGGLPVTALAVLAAAASFEAWAGMGHALAQGPRTRAALGRLAAIAALPQRAQTTRPIGVAELTFGSAASGITIPAGGRIRIEGPSGSGKTRLLGTLAGLRDDAPERVAIAGKACVAFEFDAVRQLFALSPQDAPLVAGTVADNLRLARAGASTEAMWQALQVACLDETIRGMPEGLDTWLGADGARLSGGQRKRLSLARALLAGRPWLLLDEPSEGLDRATERRLVEKLDGWLRETGTGLVLANHRPGLNRLCPTVLYLPGGD